MRLLTEAAPALASTPADNEIGPQQNALELRQSMESLRAELLAGAPLSAARHAAEPTAADTRIIEQAIEAGCSPSRGIGGKKARARNCPICAAQGQALFHFFAQWQYTLATDATARRAFAASGGLCPIHTWQFQEMASPQGISEGYAPLIEMLAAVP